MILQAPGAATSGAHPLSGTLADWIGLLPLIPLLGFVINGIISLFGAYRSGPADPTLAAEVAHGAGPGTEAVHTEHAPSAAHAGAHPRAGLVSVIGPAVLGATFAFALALFFTMTGAGELQAPFVKEYFRWIPMGDLELNWAFQLDQLSMLMTLIITGVGFLIHVFSVGYMREDPGYPRYFAYLNLFVAFMLVLVLGASYPVMFIGWEGVGLCSYLLIGFWFSEKANADAGKKAFIVNRIGDFGFLVAIFLMYVNLGALDYLGVAAAAGELAFGGVLVTAICLFLFLGCTGKSAQIPLYTWLPDAMAGPTPVSALIHAATMVTAGVYLVARSGFLFALAPAASLTVAIIGALTAFFAATIGLKQWDIKKVLAYSTVSQLGYMFIGVGVGAYVSGIFHLTTHAFFKALLFLGSGSVIYAMHRAYHHTHSHEDAQDMRNMGGLRKYMPVTFILMWIATLAIAGIPPLSGFFSKDEILAHVFARAGESTLAQATWLGIPGHSVLYAIYALGLGAALLTAIYMTRMMLYTFHGPNRTGEAERPHLAEAPWVMTGPLIVLGVLSALGGWLNLPHILPLGPTEVLEHWLEPVTGAATAAITAGAPALPPANVEWLLIGAAVLIALLGIGIAFARLKPERLVPAREAPPEHGIERVLAHKYYVDEAYDAAIVRPTVAVSRRVLWRGVDTGIIDGLFVNGSAWFARGIGWIGSQLQSGQTGTYAWGIVIGVLAVLGAFTFR
ncbi:MAG TPA: NADH-quinone oxidoreductase subunit L [Gemmatimonadaceae bacterium]|nr:NADH-quinone oxidoreductase subunit L [Gemmatimonadaceae bacterium]